MKRNLLGVLGLPLFLLLSCIGQQKDSNYPFTKSTLQDASPSMKDTRGAEEGLQSYKYYFTPLAQDEVLGFTRNKTLNWGIRMVAHSITSEKESRIIGECIVDPIVNT